MCHLFLKHKSFVHDSRNTRKFTEKLFHNKPKDFPKLKSICHCLMTIKCNVFEHREQTFTLTNKTLLSANFLTAYFMMVSVQCTCNMSWCLQCQVLGTLFHEYINSHRYRYDNCSLINEQQPWKLSTQRAQRQMQNNLHFNLKNYKMWRKKKKCYVFS